MSDFKAKMHKIRFQLGLRARPRWESLQRSTDPLAVFKGPSSKERAGKGWRGGKDEGKGRGEGSEGRGRKIFWPRTAAGEQQRDTKRPQTTTQ